MKGPTIEFDRVNLTLGATSILEDVTFTVRAATIHCIVGANGGGKTSLVRSLLGQMPHSGRITIQWAESRVIGYVPQTLDFDKSLPITVGDFMAMATQRMPVFLGVSKARRDEIDRTLERLGLNGKRKAKLGSLSGGERQRVLLAQALIPEPALLVLDEPTTGLDPEVRRVVWQVLTDRRAADRPRHERQGNPPAHDRRVRAGGRHGRVDQPRHRSSRRDRRRPDVHRPQGLAQRQAS
jgi:zinc transport system ATP-binding protein